MLEHPNVVGILGCSRNVIPLARAEAGGGDELGGTHSASGARAVPLRPLGTCASALGVGDERAADGPE